MIVAAAIQMGEFTASVAAPGRHHDVNYALSRAGLTPSQVSAGVEGFLSDKWAFLTRLEALVHVQECGQEMLRTTPHALGLFSEDLW
ncbi:hypothetical protein Acf1_000011 [Acidovorax phage ACF1]|nr:hypothetical protein Acf1_000011 [Acidovorax phage ACF1]